LKLLLLSNSGRPLFAHAATLMRDFLASRITIGFVSAASLGDEGAYFDLVQDRLTEENVAASIRHLDWSGDWRTDLEAVEAVLVGGGNTYALMSRLRTSGLGEAIAERVSGGMPYIGSSAGTNVTGPNILTTNDWNVGGFTEFDGLGLVECNLNVHYQAGAREAATAETREDRLGEYMLIRSNPVVAIEEGAAIEVRDGCGVIRGDARGRLFQANAEPRWLEAGEEIAPEIIGLT